MGEQVVELAMKFGPKVVVAAIIVAAGVVVGRWAADATARALERFQLEPPVQKLLHRATRLFVLGFFLLIALQNLGVELLPLIAGLGVMGAGIALAMQGVLSNIVAGLTIIFTKPFRVGEYISIVKEEGEVLDISVFNTVLGHSDRSRVVIPNRKIVGEILHNYGRIRQLSVEVTISYESDVGAALAAVEKVLAANPRVLREPAGGVSVVRLGVAGATLCASPWVNAPDYGAASAEINRAVLEALGRMVATDAYLRGSAARAA